MTTNTTGWMALGAMALGFFSMACESGGVGDPCIPEDEYQTAFSGYSLGEVNVESRSFQCETRVCLVNQFQGRVSCPYGQTQTGTDNGTDPTRCRVPGTSGKDAKDVIAVAVPPQHPDRSPSDAVYCSCRCENAQGSKDDGANYCDCPSGFSCEQLIDDVGLGNAQLAGGYCVRDGKLNPPPPGKQCTAAAKDCGNDGKNP